MDSLSANPETPESRRLADVRRLRGDYSIWCEGEVFMVRVESASEDGNDYYGNAFCIKVFPEKGGFSNFSVNIRPDGSLGGGSHYLSGEDGDPFSDRQRSREAIVDDLLMCLDTNAKVLQPPPPGKDDITIHRDTFSFILNIARAHARTEGVASALRQRRPGKRASPRAE